MPSNANWWHAVASQSAQQPVRKSSCFPFGDSKVIWSPLGHWQPLHQDAFCTPLAFCPTTDSPNGLIWIPPRTHTAAAWVKLYIHKPLWSSSQGTDLPLSIYDPHGRTRLSEGWKCIVAQPCPFRCILTQVVYFAIRKKFTELLKSFVNLWIVWQQYY